MDWEDYAEWSCNGMSDQTSYYSLEDIYQEFKKRLMKEMQEELTGKDRVALSHTQGEK